MDFLIHWPPGPVVATVQCQGLNYLSGYFNNHHHRFPKTALHSHCLTIVPRHSTIVIFTLDNFPIGNQSIRELETFKPDDLVLVVV